MELIRRRRYFSATTFDTTIFPPADNILEPEQKLYAALRRFVIVPHPTPRCRVVLPRCLLGTVLRFALVQTRRAIDRSYS